MWRAATASYRREIEIKALNINTKYSNKGPWLLQNSALNSEREFYKLIHALKGRQLCSGSQIL